MKYLQNDHVDPPNQNNNTHKLSKLGNINMSQWKESHLEQQQILESGERNIFNISQSLSEIQVGKLNFSVKSF